MTVIRLAADGLLLLAAIGCLYLGFAIVATWRFARRRPAPSVAPEPVSILKPLHGAEPGLLRRLASFVAQDYAAPVQFVFGVADRRDPAIAAVHALAAAFPEADIELVVDPRQHGANRKVSNLANMLPAAKHGIIVLADSDIEVGRDYLARLAAELARPGVGAVTCLYSGEPEGNLWSRIAALQVDSHFLPSAIVGITIGYARPAFGSTIALRRGTLDAIGGFRGIADALADDFELGAAVRATGQTVTVPPFLVGHGSSETTAGDLLRQELRWARTIRGVDPWGYFGTFVTHPLPLSLLSALLGSLWGLVLAAVAAGLRIGLCRTVERGFGIAPRPYWLLPFRDLVSFWVYLRAWFGAGVHWRGQEYRVTSDGSLIEERRAPLP